MKLLSQRHVYLYIQLLSFLMPLSGYIIDSQFHTGPTGFIILTLAGVALFTWSYIRQKKATNSKELRAVDWISTGCTMQIAGNHEEAIIAFTRACELEPEAVLTYFARGRSYWELGALDQAIKDFDSAIELNPKFAEAYDKRGTCYSTLGNHEKAVKDFDTAIELNVKFAAAYINRGTVYGMLGNREQEILDIQAAARLGYKAAQNLLKSKGVEW